MGAYLITATGEIDLDEVPNLDSSLGFPSRPDKLGLILNSLYGDWLYVLLRTNIGTYC